jgi:phosphate acetyltransferase
MLQLENNILTKAKQLQKTIIILEGNDPRVAEANSLLTSQQICKVILLEKYDNFTNSSFKKDLAHELFLLRQKKGLTETEAQRLIEDPFYFGVMLVKMGYADGLVGAASSPSVRLLKPTLQILKPKNGKLVSGFFIVTTPQKYFIFADCAINIDPDATLLAEIANDSVISYKNLIGDIPKVAFLSYSTRSSGHGPSVDKVKEATALFKQKNPEIIVDGEIQFDAAIAPEVSVLKSPDSPLKGDANILIFPNLDSGNIGYKLAQRFGHNIAIGPLIQGLEKPVNDLSRGCTSKEIVLNAAVTAIQSSL